MDPYSRWEYVYKGIAAAQPLRTMRPDGSGGEEFFGDNIANPGVFWQGAAGTGRTLARPWRRLLARAAGSGPGVAVGRDQEERIVRANHELDARRQDSDRERWIVIWQDGLQTNLSKR